MQLQGSFVAIVTPFTGGKFDAAAFAKLVEFQIENGTSGIVPCGTTGESATLSHDEHNDVVRACIAAVKGRAHVMAGTGSNSTREALELTQTAKDDGADSALLITPYYNKPTQEGLYLHYKTIAENVDIPIVVYNCPGRTGVSIAPATLKRLSSIPNIVAVKDATANTDWTSEVARDTKLTILSGDDNMTVPFMALGAKGVISVSANIAPRMVADLCAAGLAGDFAKARELHLKLFELTRTLFIESNPIPVKTAVGMMGLASAELRMPLCAMGAENEARLRAELVRIGLLKV